MINPLATMIAADHLQDLLREAEQERRWKVARSAQPSNHGQLSTGRRAASALRRLRDALTGSHRSRPANA